MSDHLFVYGTLRRSTGLAMAEYLAQHATYLGAGRCQGRLYDLGHYPGFVPGAQPEEQVVGDLYRLHDPAGTLPMMDAYEEYGPAFPAPNEYLRRELPVRLGDGQRIRAWVYVYNWPVDKDDRIHSGDFARQATSCQ